VKVAITLLTVWPVPRFDTETAKACETLLSVLVTQFPLSVCATISPAPFAQLYPG
jgi:hypothetical protein